MPIFNLINDFKNTQTKIDYIIIFTIKKIARGKKKRFLSMTHEKIMEISFVWQGSGTQMIFFFWYGYSKDTISRIQYGVKTMTHYKKIKYSKITSIVNYINVVVLSVFFF